MDLVFLQEHYLLCQVIAGHAGAVIVVVVAANASAVVVDVVAAGATAGVVRVMLLVLASRRHCTNMAAPHNPCVLFCITTTPLSMAKHNKHFQ